MFGLRFTALLLIKTWVEHTDCTSGPFWRYLICDAFPRRFCDQMRLQLLLSAQCLVVCLHFAWDIFQKYSLFIQSMLLRFRSVIKRLSWLLFWESILRYVPSSDFIVIRSIVMIVIVDGEMMTLLYFAVLLEDELRFILLGRCGEGRAMQVGVSICHAVYPDVYLS